jgi:hypothetical protein
MSRWRIRLASLCVPYADANSANSADSLPPRRLGRPFGANGTNGIAVDSQEAASAVRDVDTLPSAPCLQCGRGNWWRLSVVSGGPGPWQCVRCTPHGAEDWIDGRSVPVADF